MGLNKAKGNMYSDFITHTWNTVKGRCPHDCTYCYMKKWGELKPTRFDEKELKTDLGSGNKIFVGSSCDMFAFGIDNEWIIETLGHCKKYDNEYFFQSKNPYRLYIFSNEFPKKTTVCTTIETNREYTEMGNTFPGIVRARTISSLPEKIKRHVTIEPIMKFDHDEMVNLIKISGASQVNIGADSSPAKNNLPEPEWGDVMRLKDALEAFTTVKMKKNILRLSK